MGIDKVFFDCYLKNVKLFLCKYTFIARKYFLKIISMNKGIFQN